MDDIGVTVVERSTGYLRAATVLRTLGWLSIVWGCMISIWIWMGERVGSDMWLWWTLGQFAAGAVCLFAAGRLKLKGVKAMTVSMPGTKPIETDRAA